MIQALEEAAHLGVKNFLAALPELILAAGEMLSPDSVDGIILLAPSVCVDYDLRPALRAVRHGIDVFHSDRDSVILGALADGDIQN